MRASDIYLYRREEWKLFSVLKELKINYLDKMIKMNEIKKEAALKRWSALGKKPQSEICGAESSHGFL